jgi:hypothetical protein
MPKWLKVLLVVGGVLLALTAMCIGGGVYWFQSNKDQFLAVGNQAKAEGQKFGGKSDDTGCVREALSRLDAASGMMNEVRHKVFLSACLEAAGATPGFCEGVPSRDELMSSVTWALQVCGEYEAKDPQACGRLVQEVQGHCHEKKK